MIYIILDLLYDHYVRVHMLPL